jgi:hypothetical protein
MFRNNIIKITIAFLGLSVLTIGFLVLWLSYDLPKTKQALALPDPSWAPLQGWAWTDTYGWLSFNCRNSETDTNCKNGSHDYWVAVDEATGKLDGYAWSDNVGWIEFNPLWSDITTAGLDTNFYNNCGAGCNSAVDNCSSCYNKTTRKFYGWARVLSEASGNDQYDAGWIKLDGVNFDLKAIDETDSQVSGNPKGGAPWGDLLGWAWGGAKALFADGTPIGPNATSGIGWLSFNCVNEASCPSVNLYKVTGRPDALGALQINRIDGNDSYGLHIDWSNGYPAYGATSYEVWRQSGRCSNIPEDCDSDVYCPGGTCDFNLPYEAKATTTVNNFHDDQPLNLFVTYNYVVRDCNIFACSKTSARSLQTSPIEYIRNFKATPICAAPGTQQASYVDMAWSKPYIFSLFNGALAEYELDYCKLDVSGDVSKCGGGLLSEGKGYWIPAVAGCASPIAYDGQAAYSCREVLLSSDARYQSKDFYVYRVRGVANKGTCLGGNNCVNNADCGTGGDCQEGACVGGNSCFSNTDCGTAGDCDLFKSTWAFSNVFRICPVGTSYQEQRPQ